MQGDMGKRRGMLQVSWILIPCKWCCAVLSSILAIARLKLPLWAYTLRYTFSHKGPTSLASLPFILSIGTNTR